MKFSRSLFAAAGASMGAALLRYPAHAAEFTYKFGHQVPPDHPFGVRAQGFADKVTQESGGRLEIKVFPESILGSDPAMLTQARAGALEFFSAGDNVLTNIAPVCGITSVPFAFSSYKEAWNAVDGPLGKYTRGVISKLDLHPFDREWDDGFRQMVNGVRAVQSPADLKGLKFRVVGSPMSVAFFRSLGITPTSVPNNETYVSLQTHIVDGLDYPLINVEKTKVYEVQKYIAITNHVWTGVTLVASAAAWQRLPKSLQDIVERNVDAYGKLERIDISGTDVPTTASLKAKGMIFTQPDVSAFRAVLRGANFYGTWRDSFGAEPWGLLEKSVGKLA